MPYTFCEDVDCLNILVTIRFLNNRITRQRSKVYILVTIRYSRTSRIRASDLLYFDKRYWNINLEITLSLISRIKVLLDVYTWCLRHIGGVLLLVQAYGNI